MAEASIVVDSSALLELILPGPRFPEVATIVTGKRMSAPDALGLEILSVLRREVRLGHIGDETAPLAGEAFRSAPIRYWQSFPLIPRLWDMRHNISSYDAAYVALAELLTCPLVTVDERLRRAPGLTVETLP